LHLINFKAGDYSLNLNSVDNLQGALNRSAQSQKSNDVKSSKNSAKLQKVAEGFESLFIYQLLEEMKRTIPGEDSWKPDKDIEYDMLFQNIADTVSKGGGIGIADFLKNKLVGGDEGAVDKLRSMQSTVQLSGLRPLP
jgi:Rod binding domain-containing protein